MERDFMGLNSRGPVTVVKEEAAEGCKVSGLFKDQQVQWSLLNAFDPSNKRQSGENQKNFNHNMEGDSHISITPYPVHHTHEMQMLPGSNTGVSLSMNNPFFKTQYGTGGQSFMAVSAKPHFLGGIPIAAPPTIFPFISSTPGNTEPWLNLKTSQPPTQLTIFYGGSVNVFANISAEKAQAIMLLASNGSSSVVNVGQPKHPVQAPISKPVAEDAFYVNQQVNTPPYSGLSSPISVSSRPVRQSDGVLIKSEESAKTNGGSTTPVNKVETPNIGTSRGPAATTMIQSAVPQARKASLARFLEKRKERVMNSAPYNKLSKKTSECTTPGFNGVGLSGNPDLVSLSISTGKDNNSH